MASSIMDVTNLTPNLKQDRPNQSFTQPNGNNRVEAIGNVNIPQTNINQPLILDNDTLSVLNSLNKTVVAVGNAVETQTRFETIAEKNKADADFFRNQQDLTEWFETNKDLTKEEFRSNFGATVQKQLEGKSQAYVEQYANRLEPMEANLFNDHYKYKKDKFDVEQLEHLSDRTNGLLGQVLSNQPANEEERTAYFAGPAKDLIAASLKDLQEQGSELGLTKKQISKMFLDRVAIQAISQGRPDLLDFTKVKDKDQIALVDTDNALLISNYTDAAKNARISIDNKIAKENLAKQKAMEMDIELRVIDSELTNDVSQVANLHQLVNNNKELLGPEKYAKYSKQLNNMWSEKDYASADRESERDYLYSYDLVRDDSKSTDTKIKELDNMKSSITKAHYLELRKTVITEDNKDITETKLTPIEKISDNMVKNVRKEIGIAFGGKDTALGTIFDESKADGRIKSVKSQEIFDVLVYEFVKDNNRRPTVDEAIGLKNTAILNVDPELFNRRKMEEPVYTKKTSKVVNESPSVITPAKIKPALIKELTEMKEW